MGGQCNKKFRKIPRANSPYPKKMCTLEDLELDTDDDIIDVTNMFTSPP